MPWNDNNSQPNASQRHACDVTPTNRHRRAANSRDEIPRMTDEELQEFNEQDIAARNEWSGNLGGTE